MDRSLHPWKNIVRQDGFGMKGGKDKNIAALRIMRAWFSCDDGEDDKSGSEISAQSKFAVNQEFLSKKVSEMEYGDTSNLKDNNSGNLDHEVVENSKENSSSSKQLSANIKIEENPSNALGGKKITLPVLPSAPTSLANLSALYNRSRKSILIVSPEEEHTPSSNQPISFDLDIPLPSPSPHPNKPNIDTMDLSAITQSEHMDRGILGPVPRLDLILTPSSLQINK